MSDDLEQTILDAIDSAVYDKSRKVVSKEHRHAPSSMKEEPHSNDPLGSTQILPPSDNNTPEASKDAPPAKKNAPAKKAAPDKDAAPAPKNTAAKKTPPAHAKKAAPATTVAPAMVKAKRKPSTALIASAVIAIVAIAAVAVILMSRSAEPDIPQEEILIAEEPVADQPAVPSASALYEAAITELNTDFPESIEKGLSMLSTLAKDSAYIPAKLEYGILLARPTSSFPDVSERQKQLGLSPDIDTSTSMLSEVLAADPDNFKAAYWIYNNLMTKFDHNTISQAEIKQMVDTFRIFKSAVNKADSEDALKYKNAMLGAGDEDTLRAWALI